MDKEKEEEKEEEVIETSPALCDRWMWKSDLCGYGGGGEGEGRAGDLN